MTEFTPTDYTHMARALQLAENGLYTTDPNPRVGCVLVREGRVVGEGWHARAGEPHAEVLALQAAGDLARGATAYVSLEPCNHHGRTPPCVDALLAAGVGRVVAALEDPNPRVAGAGLARLAAAGVQVAAGLLEEQARAVNAGFLRRVAGGRPLVRVKLAASLDGRTAMASGESRWITGAAARRDVHRLRARSSAVLTGAGTVLADDPRLTVRDFDGRFTPPLRVVLDPALRCPPDAAVLQGPEPSLLLHAPGQVPPRRLMAESVQRHPVAPAPEGLDLGAVLDLLAAREVNEVLVESGATLAGAFIAAGLVDELWVYLAPCLMGHDGRALLRLPGLEQMAERVQLGLKELRPVGDDLRLVLVPAAVG